MGRSRPSENATDVAIAATLLFACSFSGSSKVVAIIAQASLLISSSMSYWETLPRLHPSTSARRKVIYLELHPETAKGAKNQHTMELLNDTMSFSNDTAKKTGKSKRTTERKVSIGEKLGGMQDAIKAAGIDDSQKDLTELAKLKDKSPDQIKDVYDSKGEGS